MKERRLTQWLYKATSSEQLLHKLNQRQFNINDKTTKGDSIFHLFVKSLYSGCSQNVLKVFHRIIAAGVDVNLTNKEGVSGISYLIASAADWPGCYELIPKVLALARVDVNQLNPQNESLFEQITTIKSDGHQALALQALLRHPDFSPNQKLKSYHNPIQFLLLEHIPKAMDHIQSIIRHKNFDPGIKNPKGKNIIALAIQTQSPRRLETLKLLCQHELFEVNEVDSAGNNYLQILVAYPNPYKSKQILQLFLTKGIDLNHKNNIGHTIQDSIIENIRKKYYSFPHGFNLDEVRSGLVNLMIVLWNSLPTLALKVLADGRTLFETLMSISHHQTDILFTTYLETQQHLGLTEDAIGMISKVLFDSFCSATLPGTLVEKKLKHMIRLNIPIDVEYGVAIIWLHNAKFGRHELLKKLQAIRPVESDKVIAYLKQLTPADSIEQKKIIDQYQFSVLFHLNNFTEEVLTLEESFNIRSNDDLIYRDIKMFAHLFSLDGMIPYGTGICDLTGSISEHTGPFFVHLMNAFVRHCEDTGQFKEYLEEIKKVRNMTVKGMRYFFLLDSTSNYNGLVLYSRNEICKQIWEDSKQDGIEMYTGWRGHFIQLMVRGAEFYRHNGGQCHAGATTEIYKMLKPEQFDPRLISHLYANEYTVKNKKFIQQKLHNILGLELQSKIVGGFQQVGNCNFENKRIGLQTKFRFFLPNESADKIYKYCLSFFESYHLNEFCTRYKETPFFADLLMRLVVSRLIPDKKYKLIRNIVTNYFKSEQEQEIMQMELLIAKWNLSLKEKNGAEFTRALNKTKIKLNPEMSQRISFLNRFLNNEIDLGEIIDINSWSPNHLIFQGYTLLHIAVRNNNMQLAHFLIKSNPHCINVRTWSGKDALCLAQSGAMIRLLVKAGADTSDTQYDNALDFAIKTNKLECVQAMLFAGVKPSKHSVYYAASRDCKILEAVLERYPMAAFSKTSSNRNGVHSAALKGKSENLHRLVYYSGCNPGKPDVNGFSPLHLALSNNHQETAKLLIKSPCTLFAATNRGDTVFEMTSNPELLRALHKKHGQKHEDMDYFKKLFKKGVGERGFLISAIKARDIRAVRGCLLLYPEINVVNWTAPGQKSLLQLAIENGFNNEMEYHLKLKIIKLLLKTPAINLNKKQDNGGFLLYKVIAVGDVKILELFLQDPKLNINQDNNSGNTALHLAAKKLNQECLRRLLEDERTDSFVINDKGQSVLDVIDESRADGLECKQLIIEYQAMARRRRGQRSLS